MSFNKSGANDSTGELVPDVFFNDVYDDMDATAMQVDVPQPQAAQLAADLLKRFNEAWSVSPTDSDTSPTTTNVSHSDTSSRVGIPKEFPVQSNITPTPSEVSEEQPGPSGLQTVDHKTKPSITNISQGLQGSKKTHNVENMPVQPDGRISDDGPNSEMQCKSISKEDDANGAEDYSRQRKHSRSRRRRSRYHSRSRSRSPQSRYYYHSRSRSPRSRRHRRRRSRSRSRHRSRSVPRSVSRSSRSSRSDEREWRYRSHSRHGRHGDPALLPMANQSVAPTPDIVMIQSVVTMAMQMALASTSNRIQPAALGDALQAALNAPNAPAIVNQTPTVPQSKPSVAIDGNSTQAPEPTTYEESKTPYDVPTELFLEAKISLGDYLTMKPTSRDQRIINPKVYDRIKEAISILERQETKEQTPKFLYVPPTYYNQLRKKDTRSPLVWNDRNVLFGLTSRSREVKLCEPFGNVNRKLKGLIVKFGLDEGVISQRLQKNALRAIDNAAPTTVVNGASSRIQAISMLPAKPGSAKMRHMIERAIQTEGYACGQCVERAKKTCVATSSQTTFSLPRKLDATVQTTKTAMQSSVPTITLEKLSSSQIETIGAIVRFIRARHVTGPVDSVQHALSKDPTARITMGGDLFQNVQELLSRMTEPSRASSSSSGSRYAPCFQQQGQLTRSISITTNQTNPPPVHAPSGGRYSSCDKPGKIAPACYVAEVPMSKKARKRLKSRRDAMGGKE